MVTAVLLVLAVGFLTATYRWFVWPQQGMPAKVDAIVMLNGPGNRLTTAEDLAWAHRAPMLVVSRGSAYWGHGSVCAPRIPAVKVICFDPSPPTTRGEAEFVGELAARYHWRSIVLVTIAPQITPGRIWLGRCLTAKIYAVAAPLHGASWPVALMHEWGSAINALVFERSC